MNKLDFNMKLYYDDYICNSYLNIIKHLFLFINILWYLFTVLYLCIAYIFPFYFYLFHIMPYRSSIPRFYSFDGCQEAIFDMHATYDALFIAPIREYYILQYFGKDIANTILLYLGNSKDLSTLIDHNKKMIQSFVLSKNKK